tara:strand:+ start:2418 stop:3017 length:600 start_codon:yes stop_codon:yes gene_type:complete
VEKRAVFFESHYSSIATRGPRAGTTTTMDARRDVLVGPSAALLSVAILGAAVLLFTRSTGELEATDILREHLADVCDMCAGAVEANGHGGGDGETVATIAQTQKSSHIMLCDATSVLLAPFHEGMAFPHGFAAQNEMLRTRVASQKRTNGHLVVSLVDPRDMRARTEVVAYRQTHTGNGGSLWVIAWRRRGADEKNTVQ